MASINGIMDAMTSLDSLVEMRLIFALIHKDESRDEHPKPGAITMFGEKENTFVTLFYIDGKYALEVETTLSNLENVDVSHWADDTAGLIAKVIRDNPGRFDVRLMDQTDWADRD